MKKLLAILTLVLLAFSVIATDVDQELGIVITPEQFEPRVFLDPNTRLVLDDCMEPGAVSGCGQLMVEREHDYGFQGEQIFWELLVWDKNGDDKISDVYVKVRMLSQPESYMQVNCYATTRFGLGIGTDVNQTAEIPDVWYEGEEELTWNPDTMDWYQCEFTIESPQSMQGEYMLTAEAVDVDGLTGIAAEEEQWFFNPVIALGVTGSVEFGEVRPGATVKSSTVTIGNAAEDGSGVMLDMYIAGTDFYDLTSSGAMCPTSNVLSLTNFRYRAVSGSYDTCTNPGIDGECYDTIPYFMTGAGAPPNNNMQRMIGLNGPVYPFGNVLSPGSEMSVNFKLALPEPCNGGSFSDGSFKIVGEAV